MIINNEDKYNNIIALDYNLFLYNLLAKEFKARKKQNKCRVSVFRIFREIEKERRSSKLYKRRIMYGSQSSVS
jgi:hypothetical protein